MAFVTIHNEVWCWLDRCLKLPSRESREEAIAAWNTRPTEASIRADQTELQVALERQMEEDQDEHLPSSLARERGLVWLEGWFDLAAAIRALPDPAASTRGETDGGGDD